MRLLLALLSAALAGCASVLMEEEYKTDIDVNRCFSICTDTTMKRTNITNRSKTKTPQPRKGKAP